MSVSKLPSGRYRAQVYDENTGKVVSAAKILGLVEPTFATKRAAEDAVTDARRRLTATAGNSNVTVQDWFDRWTRNPLYHVRRNGAALKSSSLKAARDRTCGFAAKYGNRRMTEIDRSIVFEWLEGGSRLWTLDGLRKMFNEAKRAGIVQENPFAALGFSKGNGNVGVDPPSEALAERMRRIAWEGRNERWGMLCPPGFAGWFQFAQATGMRGGEVDALRWRDVDYDAGVIHVRQTYNSTTREFTTPKNGTAREVVMLPMAREALLKMVYGEPDDFVFTNSHGDPWTQPARRKYWERLREKAGWDKSLYLATRHFAGHFLYELCGIDAEDVAIMFGHKDGGELIRNLYGHRNAGRAQDRIREAVARQLGTHLKAA